MESMTGFGKAEGLVLGTQYTVEIKSTNHKYFDLRYRAPGPLSLFEITLTDWIKKSWFERGSFELFLRPRVARSEIPSIPGGTQFVVDEAAAESLMRSVRWLEKKYKTAALPSLEVMAFTNRVFVPVDTTENPSEKLEELKKLVGVALQDLKQMRVNEGQKLMVILLKNVEELSQITSKISTLASGQPERARQKLLARIKNWDLSESVDEKRLEWEVAFYADRADVTEEIDRLKVHLKNFEALAKSNKAIGRKLDFLTQELNREVNTINSKASDLEITQLAVEAKSWVERLREQVQNVE